MTRRIAGTVLALLLLSSCSDEPTLEQQIIGLITEMEQLMESGKRGAFMKKVAEDFSGQLGALTRDEFRRFMIMQWNQNQRLHAQLFPISVRKLGPGMAAANFKALITGGRGLIPERGQLYQFETTWLKNGDDWLLLSANWDPVRLEAD